MPSAGGSSGAEPWGAAGSIHALMHEAKMLAAKRAAGGPVADGSNRKEKKEKKQKKEKKDKKERKEKKEQKQKVG